MAFYGEYFSFDNISSERYGLKITTESSDNTISVSEYKSDLIKTPRRSKFYATKQRVDEPLLLAISIFSETPLTRNQIDNIEGWLFRTDGQFRKLRINQPDMQGYYYNCRLQKLSVKSYYNKPHEFSCVMQCDSQYVWQNQQTRTYITSSLPYVAKFVNTSSQDYMQPTYVLTCNSINGTINVYNSKFEDVKLQTMELTGLQNGEIITLDSEHGIITSNLRTIGLLDLFTYPNFMQLERGSHEFVLSGNISEFKIIYQNARKVGD